VRRSRTKPGFERHGSSQSNRRCRYLGRILNLPYFIAGLFESRKPSFFRSIQACVRGSSSVGDCCILGKGSSALPLIIDCGQIDRVAIYTSQTSLGTWRKCCCAFDEQHLCLSAKFGLRRRVCSGNISLPFPLNLTSNLSNLSPNCVCICWSCSCSSSGCKKHFAISSGSANVRPGSKA